MDCFRSLIVLTTRDSIKEGYSKVLNGVSILFSTLSEIVKILRISKIAVFSFSPISYIGVVFLQK